MIRDILAVIVLCSAVSCTIALNLCQCKYGLYADSDCNPHKKGGLAIILNFTMAAECYSINNTVDGNILSGMTDADCKHFYQYYTEQCDGEPYWTYHITDTCKEVKAYAVYTDFECNVIGDDTPVIAPKPADTPKEAEPPVTGELQHYPPAPPVVNACGGFLQFYRDSTCSTHPTYNLSAIVPQGCSTLGVTLLHFYFAPDSSSTEVAVSVYIPPTCATFATYNETSCLGKPVHVWQLDGKCHHMYKDLYWRAHHVAPMAAQEHEIQSLSDLATVAQAIQISDRFF